MKKMTKGFMVCLLPFGGYPKGYVSRWGPYPSSEGALLWARRSGLSPVTGPAATAMGYGPDGRPGRVWIEESGKPATA